MLGGNCGGNSLQLSVLNEFEDPNVSCTIWQCRMRSLAIRKPAEVRGWCMVGIKKIWSIFFKTILKLNDFFELHLLVLGYLYADECCTKILLTVFPAVLLYLQCSGKRNDTWAKLWVLACSLNWLWWGRKTRCCKINTNYSIG